jgi:serine/threonine protein phosphatase PrpC
MSRFKVSACTAEHIGDRPEQQDRVAILTSPRHPNSLLAVVSDGMGGRSGGRIAADQVISTMTQVFRDTGEDDAGSLRELLQTMAEEAHTVIRLSALSSEKEPHATFVALIVRRDYAVWGHAGDSRLYHFRDGRLMHRTEDQTYAYYLRSQGREQQALEADQKFKHMLVSSLGLPRPPQLLFGETDESNPFVPVEQMMPFVPFVRCRDVDEAIAKAKRAEHGFKHTSIIHSNNVRNMTKMGRALETTLFVKNGPCMAALGLGGEGYLSYSIAGPTGEGVTTPLTFTRERRCSMIDDLWILGKA